MTGLAKCDAVLEAMQKQGLPLLVHAEVTDADIDVFDREAVFIERHMIALAQKFPALPALKIVFETYHHQTCRGFRHRCSL